MSDLCERLLRSITISVKCLSHLHASPKSDAPIVNDLEEYSLEGTSNGEPGIFNRGLERESIALQTSALPALDK